MTELPESSSKLSTDPAVLQAADLLRYYSFDLNGYSLDQQLSSWLTHYPAKWVQLAVVEALYQGRYKVVSVGQILVLWLRRGQPLCHFNHEFERLVSSKISPAAIAPPSPPPEPPQPTFQKPTLSYRKMLLQLPSADAASKLDRLAEIPSLKLARLAERNLSPEWVSESQNGVSRSPTSTFTPSSQPTERDRLNEDEEFRKFKEGVVFALSSGLAVHTLHPTLRLKLSQYYSLDWENFNLTLAQLERQ